MRRAFFIAGVLALVAACSTGPEQGERTPAGTPTDPVKVCARMGDVCELGDSRLGVCVETPTPDCGDETCFVCQPQH